MKLFEFRPYKPYRLVLWMLDLVVWGLAGYSAFNRDWSSLGMVAMEVVMIVALCLYAGILYDNENEE